MEEKTSFNVAKVWKTIQIMPDCVFPFRISCEQMDKLCDWSLTTICDTWFNSIENIVCRIDFPLQNRHYEGSLCSQGRRGRHWHSSFWTRGQVFLANYFCIQDVALVVSSLELQILDIWRTGFRAKKKSRSQKPKEKKKREERERKEEEKRWKGIKRKEKKRSRKVWGKTSKSIWSSSR